jgi:hypothetical protein
MPGGEYPNYLHAVRNNTFVLNSFVSDQMDCAVHLRCIEECPAPETRGRIWVKGSYNNAELDGDDNLIGYEAPDAVVGSSADSNYLPLRDNERVLAA